MPSEANQVPWKLLLRTTAEVLRREVITSCGQPVEIDAPVRNFKVPPKGRETSEIRAHHAWVQVGGFTNRLAEITMFWESHLQAWANVAAEG